MWPTLLSVPRLDLPIVREQAAIFGGYNSRPDTVAQALFIIIRLTLSSRLTEIYYITRANIALSECYAHGMTPQGNIDTPVMLNNKKTLHG